MGGTGQVLLQDVGVGGIDEGVLVRAAEQIPRVPHEVLVEGVIQGDEHGQGVPRAPSGPAGLLPQAGDGARKTNDHRGVQVADIDAQLQRRGGGHPQQLPTRTQAALDLAALFRAITSTVGPHPVGQRNPLCHRRRALVLQDAPGIE